MAGADSAPLSYRPVFTSPLLPTTSQTDELRTLLRSNAPAPQGIEDLFLDGLEDLRLYDKEIATLRHERAQLKAWLDGHRSARVSFIRRLPSELLAEIIEIYAGFPEDEQFFGEDLGKLAPGKLELTRLAKRNLLELAKVCFRWREVVMGTPKLWSNISANVRAWPMSPFSRTTSLSLISASLARSGDQTLTIRLFDSQLAYDTTRQILQLLVPVAERWRHLQISLDCLELLEETKGRLDSLESLTLTPPLDCLSGQSPKGNYIFAIAPPKLNAIFLSAPTELIPRLLPWRQIRSYTHEQNSRCPDMLHSELKNLKPALSQLRRGGQFTLDARNYWMTRSSQDPPLNPPVESRVGELTLRLGVDAMQRTRLQTPDILGSIFGSFKLPYLASLSVLGQYDRQRWPVWDHRAFFELVERSGFRKSLVRLKLGVIILETDFVDLLTSFDVLEELALSDPPYVCGARFVTNRLLRALTPPSAGDASPSAEDSDPLTSAGVALVPRLHRLTLITTGILSAQALMAFLIGRIFNFSSSSNSSSGVKSKSKQIFAMQLGCVGRGGQGLAMGVEFGRFVRDLERDGVLKMRRLEQDSVGWTDLCDEF
ncbi:hypothetical protein C8F01DRAFT_1147870 [Mycena amicta]|nr:hypothetical protein C8F01DRAFT_1147870 [Mycena amicta]